MLYISLIASAVLLLFANWVVRRSRMPGIMMGCSVPACAIGPFFMMCLLPTLAIQSLLLWIAFIVWRHSRRDAWFFLQLSCGATVLAYGLGGILVYRGEREYSRLRKLYPYESMEDRVPEPRMRLAKRPLSTDSERRLLEVEKRITGHPNWMRENGLQMLHEDAVALFVNSPGFGVARMYLPNRWILEMGNRGEPEPEQPGPRFDGADWSPGEWRMPSAEEEGRIGDLLVESIEGFVRPEGFGFVKDRRHVAGFEPHRFVRSAPQPAERWKLQRLELMSLLLHDEPAVYVSDHMPEMTEAHDTPTRTLDRFERIALDELRRGEDLHSAQVGEQVRMLGAVRSARVCVECHGGGRGDLLGAFSYTLSAFR